MTTPNDETDITFLMARTTAMEIVHAIDSISRLDPWDDLEYRHRERAIETATEGLVLQFRSVFMTMDATHDHPSRERGQ